MPLSLLKTGLALSLTVLHGAAHATPHDAPTPPRASFARDDLGQLYQRDALLAQTGGRAGVGGSPAKPSKRGSLGTLRMILALSWEGRDLRAENLEAIDAFRKRFPELKVMHFVSPAYFARDPAKADEHAKLVKERVLAGDAVGLLLNGWKSVATAANVQFRGHPTFWGATLRPVDCQDDCGLEVPVNIYTVQDLRRLIAYGAQTLERHGLGRPIAIQTGGWVASPQVIESAAAEGMRYDFSAVPTSLIYGRTRHFPLLSWVTNLWKDITPATGPYELRIGTTQITEVPQNLAAVDYLEEKDATAAFSAWLDKALARGTEAPPATVTLGLYLETSNLMRPMLSHIMQGFLTAAAKQRVAVEGAVLPDPGVSPHALPPAVATDAAGPTTPVAQASPSPTGPTISEPTPPSTGAGLPKEPPKVH
jgi:hypothetical protein